MKTKWLDGWGDNFLVILVLYLMAFLSIIMGTDDVSRAFNATFNMGVALYLILNKPKLLKAIET